jgi:hypothetical protein
MASGSQSSNGSYSYTPLFTTFEDDTPGPNFYQQRRIAPAPTDTALLIPCYRSATIIGRTREAALRIFPASHIYVAANGNSSQPLDNTQEMPKLRSQPHMVTCGVKDHRDIRRLLRCPRFWACAPDRR